MTTWLALLATVVAVAAAARSTWSPCGLSMLSTITPVSERAKGNSYRSTATWFVVGATVGGATLGAVMALLAAGVHVLHLAPTTSGLVALAATLVAVVSDAGIAGIRLPIHRRQVNERWLDHYRSWVYGAGFGWQIGTGLATYITTAAVYLMIVLTTLAASPAVAVAVGTGFGLLRGTAVLLTRRLRKPAALREFHRRFAAAGSPVGRAVTAVEAAVALTLLGVVASPSALALVAAGIVVTIGLALVARVRGVAAAPACALPTGTPLVSDGGGALLRPVPLATVGPSVGVGNSRSRTG